MSETRVKSEQVLVRAEPKQKKRWERGAKRAGLSLAEWMRGLADAGAETEGGR